MVKKVICLVLSFAIFQVQAGVQSQEDEDFSAYLKENGDLLEKFINNLPQEFKEETLALENLSPEESQPIIENTLNYNYEYDEDDPNYGPDKIKEFYFMHLLRNALLYYLTKSNDNNGNSGSQSKTENCHHHFYYDDPREYQHHCHD